MVEGYAYRQLTQQAKPKILGENPLRLHGMDAASVKQRLGAWRATTPPPEHPSTVDRLTLFPPVDGYCHSERSRRIRVS
jgi:hypothetical protein